MRAAVHVALAAAFAAVAHAQPPASDTSLEVTIRLLPENAVGPQEITRRIELPPAAQAETPSERTDDSRPNAERDLRDGREPGPRVEPEPGGEVRERARGQGRDVATEARERGREAAEQARENRENAGRSDDARPPRAPPESPDDAGPPRDPPGRPDDGGPPADPPGRPDDAGPPGGPPGNP